MRVLARPARVSLRAWWAMRAPTPGHDARIHGHTHARYGHVTWAQLGALWACTIASGCRWAHTYVTRWRSGTTTHALWAHSRHMGTHSSATIGRGSESVCKGNFHRKLGLFGGGDYAPTCTDVPTCVTGRMGVKGFTFAQSESCKRLKISVFPAFAWSCALTIAPTCPLAVVNRGRTQKYAGGCARWWGFHIYTPPQNFKSVFLNRITGNLSCFLCGRFMLSPKSSSNTLLYIIHHIH